MLSVVLERHADIQAVGMCVADGTAIPDSDMDVPDSCARSSSKALTLNALPWDSSNNRLAAAADKHMACTSIGQKTATFGNCTACMGDVSVEDDCCKCISLF